MSLPSAPTLTAATNIDGAITIKWGDTIGAITHTVSITPGGFASQTVTGKVATFTGATIGTQYSVSMYATNENDKVTIIKI